MATISTTRHDELVRKVTVSRYPYDGEPTIWIGSTNTSSLGLSVEEAKWLLSALPDAIMEAETPNLRRLA